MLSYCFSAKEERRPPARRAYSIGPGPDLLRPTAWTPERAFFGRFKPDRGGQLFDCFNFSRSRIRTVLFGADESDRVSSEADSLERWFVVIGGLELVALSSTKKNSTASIRPQTQREVSPESLDPGEQRDSAGCRSQAGARRLSRRGEEVVEGGRRS